MTVTLLVTSVKLTAVSYLNFENQLEMNEIKININYTLKVRTYRSRTDIRNYDWDS